MKCGGLPSAVRYRTDFSDGRLWKFYHTPALINQCQIHLYCIDVLGGPVYVPHLVFTQYLLIAVWVQVLERNQVDDWS